MAKRAAGKVMTMPTIPQMVTMTTATRRRIWVWVVTRLARPASPPAWAFLMTVDATAYRKRATSQVKAAMALRSSVWLTISAHVVLVRSMRATCAPR